MYEISRQPELQDRLVQEISAAMGDKENPSWEDFQKMPLVRNCVKETLRIYSPTGGIARILREDAVILGYHIPAGVSAKIQWSVSFMDITSECLCMYCEGNGTTMLPSDNFFL